MSNSSPFDDIRSLLTAMEGPDKTAMGEARARNAALIKPAGSLGRLEEIAVWMAGWQGKPIPTADQPQIAIFAANHGVAAQGVSAFPSEVTQQMVENFAAGGAAINQLASLYGAGLRVFDLALDMPTPDISEAEALSEKDCAATIAFGMEAVASGGDVLILGDMGIGNTTIAAALSHNLFGGAARDWVGPGTGVDEAGIHKKIDVLTKARKRHATAMTDPLHVLRTVGGREVAAIAGAILAARIERIPVILDGYVVAAAAAVLHSINERTLDHCIAGHVSAEPAHEALLDRIGKDPLVNLGMRLGEGSGAAVALGIVKAAVACHGGMATFDQAGVSGKLAN